MNEATKCVGDLVGSQLDQLAEDIRVRVASVWYYRVYFGSKGLKDCELPVIEA